MVSIVVLLLAWTVSEAARAAVPDPMSPGPLTVDRIEYDAGSLRVFGRDPAMAIQQDLRGVLHVPQGSGPFPVLLFQHGYHLTCEDGGDIDERCRQVQNWTGYDALAASLASNGYAVISVSANQINDHQGETDPSEMARSQVIERSLGVLREWHAGGGPGSLGGRLAGRLDLGRIGLMGHSRGGEAVTRFVKDNRSGSNWPLRAVVALAPIDDNAQDPSGVPFATILPYCDGDIANLAGAGPFERAKRANSALGLTHVQWGVNGANHNWFNARWAQDGEDPISALYSADDACASGAPRRLTLPEQLDVGNVLMAGMLRAEVGGESTFRPITRGEGLPPRACPRQDRAGLTCANVVQGSWVAPDRERRPVLTPTSATAGDDGGALTVSAGMTAEPCSPSTPDSQVVQADCGRVNIRSATPQLSVRWAVPGALAVTLPTARGDVSGMRTLTLRASAAHEDPLNAAGSPALDVALTDAAGAVAVTPLARWSTALEVQPGNAARDILLTGARIPLSAFRGVDLRHVARVELRTASATGAIQLADVAFQEDASTDDTLPPATVRARGTISLRALRRPGVAVTVRCPSACVARLGLGTPGSRRVVELGPGASRTVRLPLRSQDRRGRRVRAVIRSAGRTTVLRHRLRVR